MLRLTGTGLAGGTALAVVSSTVGDPAAPRSGRPAVAAFDRAESATAPANIIYVAPPTGDAAVDTQAALGALGQAAAGSIVVFTSSPHATVYSINQELPVPEGVRVTGTGPTDEDPLTGTMPTLQQAPGTSLRCTLASAGYLAGLYATSQYNNGVAKTTADGAIEIDHLAFDGQNGGTTVGNTLGHGVVLMSTGSKVHDCYFVNTAQASIVVADANYAGTPLESTPLALQDNRIYDNKINNPGWQGIWVTALSFGPSNGYVLNNIVESPSQENLTSANGSFRGNPDNQNSQNEDLPYEALRFDNALGWWVENNHAYACPGSGFYCAATAGLHLVNNSTDAIGCKPVPSSTYVGYDLRNEATPKTNTTFINGNQVSAYEGFNTAGPHAPGVTNTFLYYRLRTVRSGSGSATWFEHANNSAHQDSQPQPSIAGATVKGNKVTVRAGAAAGVQAGMSVSDSQGVIPANTSVRSVSGNTIVLSASSTAQATDDTISFPGPSTIAWTYENDNPDATMNVMRSNETVSPTISADPNLLGPGPIVLTDPANVAGGLPVQNGFPLVPASSGPTAGQIIVAQPPTSGSVATAAAWQAVPAAVADGPAGGVLSGTYPNPTFAADLVTVLDSDGIYQVPSGATTLRVTCVGGGGGGGGGGAAPGGATAQVGGSGGASGTTSQQVVTVGDDTTLSVTIGTGGAAGEGGASGADGSDGTPGGATTVSAGGILVVGAGGAGGQGSPAGAGHAVAGAAYGATPGTFVSSPTAGCGGGSGQSGGWPIAFSPGGGGGGGSADATSGGAAGQPGSATGGGVGGVSGTGTSGAGVSGAVATDPGAPGGGGGGGAAGANGGAGGAGAGGYVIIEVVA